MEKVVWGMIGCGDVTEKKTGPALYKSSGSVLKGVYNRTTAKAEDWVKRHEHGEVYETLEALLADEEINAVYIATPPDSHRDYAIQALQAGKIPLIEKPMATTYQQSLEIMEVADQVNLPVYVNFYRRGLEKINKIKQLLASEAIGKPLIVEVQHFRKPDEVDYDRQNLPWRVTPAAGGGKALDTQVHVIDYLTYFFGPIQTAKGIATNLAGLYEVEDTTSASFRFESGVLGSAVWCYVADYQLDQVTITGTKGLLTFSGTGVNDLNVNGEEIEFTAPEHVAMPFMQSVIDEIRGLKKSPADTTAALQVTQVFEKILQRDEG